MKGLSRWAACHTTAARILIILLHVILSLIAIQTGLLFTEANVGLPENWLYISAVVYGCVLWVYQKVKRIYVLRKLNDCTIILLGFLSMVTITNRLDLSAAYHYSAPASAVSLRIIHPQSMHTTPVPPTQQKSMQSKNFQRKQFKSTFKRLYKEQKGSTLMRSNRDLLIVLLVMVAIGLTGLLGALACSVSCSGSSGGGIIIAIFGLVAIIVGLVQGIRWIKRKHPKKSIKASSP